MKALTECLEIALNESSEKYFRFTFGDLEHKDDTIKSIEDLGSKNGIYTEKVDNGVKIKLTDSNKDKVDSIQDVLQQYVDKMQNDDKADQDTVKKLADQVNSLNDYLDADDDDTDDDTDNKEDQGE